MSAREAIEASDGYADSVSVFLRDYAQAQAEAGVAGSFAQFHETGGFVGIHSHRVHNSESCDGCAFLSECTEKQASDFRAAASLGGELVEDPRGIGQILLVDAEVVG